MRPPDQTTRKRKRGWREKRGGKVIALYPDTISIPGTNLVPRALPGVISYHRTMKREKEIDRERQREGQRETEREAEREREKVTQSKTI